LNNFAILQMGAVDGVGRILGPVSARYRIAHGGQWEYAELQATITLLSILFFEVVISPSITE